MTETSSYSFDKNSFKIFDNMLEGVSVYEAVYDDNGKIADLIIKYVNPATIHGSGNACKYYIGKSVSELYGFENTKPHFKMAEEIIATGKSKTFKAYLPPLNRYFQVSGFLTHDGLFVMLRVDITDQENAEKELKKSYDNLERKVQERTYKLQNANEKLQWEVEERKKIQKKLIESEKKFRLLFNKVNDMISLSEIKENGLPGKYIEVNEVGIKRLGYSREELLNMSPADIIVPDKRAEMPKNAVNIAKNGYSSFEIVHMTKNGEKIPVEVNGHVINYKGEKVYLTVSRDITIRKKMEKDLKESEEKFREIFNNANDMITLHEMDENGMPGQFIEVNEVGSKRLGYTSKEFRKMSPIDIVAPDKRVEMANNAVKIWTEGYAKFEIVHIAKDGRRIPVEVNTHLFNLKGKKLALGVSRDMTEHKIADKKLKELLEKLSHFNEEFEQYTYITAYYLQEHLETIVNLTKNIKHEYKGKLNKGIEEFLDDVIDESFNLKQIILDLLEYSNVLSVEKVFKPVDIEKSLDQILSDLKINEDDIEITYDKLPVVIADSDLIPKVFQGLISNAREFKKEDESLKIYISARKDSKNREYIFSVRDNGIGMDQQCAEHIFTIFPLLHTQERYNITGIGPSTAKEIIEGHGGKIWVESEPGTGSVFYFTLPFNPVNSS